MDGTGHWVFGGKAGKQVTGDVSIEFNEEELLLLADLASVELPVGLGEAPEMPHEAREYLFAKARETLTARGVIEDESVDESVTALLEVAAEPGILCSCAVQRDQLVDTTFLLVTPDLAVEHAAPASSLHRFTPFPPRDFMVRLLRLVDLRPARIDGMEPFEVTLTTLEGVGADIDGGEIEAAAQKLITAGVDAEAANRFVNALRSRHSTVVVTLFYKRDPERVEGGQLSWVDCGLSGIWKVDSPGDGEEDTVQRNGDDGQATVTVTPVSAEGIAEELLSYLPGAFGDGPADDGAQSPGMSDDPGGSS